MYNILPLGKGQLVCDALFFQANGFAGFGALNLFFQLS
jgi:hypothetical protein